MGKTLRPRRASRPQGRDQASVVTSIGFAPWCPCLLPKFCSSLHPQLREKHRKLCTRLRIYLLQKTNKTPHTQCQLWDRRTVHTHTQVFSPRLPEPAWESRGAPRIGPAAVLAPLHSVSYRRGVAGGRRSPRQCPRLVSGLFRLDPSSSSPKGHHQIGSGY